MIDFALAHALALAYTLLGFGLGVFFAAWRQSQIEARR